jgi:hypothetical protein BACCOPRO_02127
LSEAPASKEYSNAPGWQSYQYKFKYKPMNMNKKELRRRDYLLYKLRKRGVRCLTRCRTIFFPYGSDPMTVPQIVNLVREYNFAVQFEIR